jgi:hypothetical protein
MSDLTVRRWAGAFGVAGFVVFLVALPLYFGGMTNAPLEDAERFSDYVTSVNTSILIRTSLADPLIMVGLLVFLAGFRHLIRQARQEYEWLATLVFGVGVIVIALELVGDGLEAGAALDTVAKANPTVVRGLMEASFRCWRNRTDYVGALVSLRGLRHTGNWGAAQMERMVCLHGCDRESLGRTVDTRGDRLHGLLVCPWLCDVCRPGSDGHLVFDRQHLHARSPGHRRYGTRSADQHAMYQW